MIIHELSIHSNENALMYINMYNHSRDILLSNPNIDNINIQCGNDADHRFILYNIDSIKSDEQLRDSAQSKYTSNHLPCEGITIDCSSNKYEMKSCKYEYYVNTLNISKILKTESSSNTKCFWMDISDIFTPYCIGSCYDNHYIYNISLDFDVIIDNYNLTKYEITDKCMHFFGSINETEDTLFGIGAIFDNIIQLVYPYKIIQVIDGPNSYLRDNKMELDCTDLSAFGEVHLTVIFSVSSIIDNQYEFKLLWSNPTFKEKVEELLSLRFGLTVKVQISYIDQDIAGSFSDEFVHGIFASLVLFIALIIFYVLYQKRKMAKELELLTTFINDPLVITLGIGQYDKFSENPDIQNTVYPDLRAVDIDMKNMVTLFENTLEYTLQPQYDIDDIIQAHWTKTEIMQLMETNAKYLEKSYGSHKHDGLVGIISGHGE